METQPTRQAMNQWEIHFPNGNQAQAILSSASTRTTDLLHTLGIQQPNVVILIAGGAAKLDEQLAPNLFQLCTYGIVPVAASLKGLIIDGGTEAGVMAIMGQAVAEQGRRLTLLGVTPAGCVTYPDKSADIPCNEEVPLDPNHSHFVLVETDEWGGETETMYALAKVLSANRPSVAVLINGGAITKSEVLHNVRQKRPIIVIEGSGRLADEIARLWKEKPSTVPDPELAEIMRHGNIHVLPITAPAIQFVQLTTRLLDR